MILLRLSQSEIEAGRLSPTTLARAKTAIADDGYVVLDRVAEPAYLQKIYEGMLEDIARWPAAHEGKPFVGGNLFPRRHPDFLFADILQNPFVADVLSAVIGAEPSCGMYSSNVTMPHLGDQQLHVDMAPIKAGDSLDYPCGSVVVNFPVIDFTLENGATEIWPATQKCARHPGEFWVHDDLRDARQEVRPPERAVISRGSALIRDIRLWHRGVLNQTDAVRPMVAMICNGQFRPGVDAIEKIAPLGSMPEACRDLFENSPEIYWNPTYVSGEIDMLTIEKQR